MLRANKAPVERQVPGDRKEIPEQLVQLAQPDHKAIVARKATPETKATKATPGKTA